MAAGKKMAKTEKKFSCPRKSGPMFSHRSEPERSEEGWKKGEKARRGFGTAMCYGRGRTIVTEEAKGLLGFQGDEGSNEVVDDGCDQDDQQEDLGLHRSKRAD